MKAKTMPKTSAPTDPFDGLVRRERGPMTAPEELAEEERHDVVELSGQDDIKDEAKATFPGREIGKVREEPSEVDDAQDGQREVLKHPLCLVAYDRHEREERDTPHGHDRE